MNMKKLAAAGLLVVGALLVISFRGSDADVGTDPELHVYKSPTCGCCSLWVDHMTEAGFKVSVEDVTNEVLRDVKIRHGVPLELSSCHTTVVGDYAIEGHVPASVVKRFLEEAPEVRGIAVPGMPTGSPGMEGPQPAAVCGHRLRWQGQPDGLRRGRSAKVAGAGRTSSGTGPFSGTLVL